MSVQPGDDDAFDLPGRPAAPGIASAANAVTGTPETAPGDGDHTDSIDSPRPESGDWEISQGRIADFEAFNRFANSERDRSGRPKQRSERRGSGALLPGAWAKAVRTGSAAASPPVSSPPAPSPETYLSGTDWPGPGTEAREPAMASSPAGASTDGVRLEATSAAPDSAGGWSGSVAQTTAAAGPGGYGVGSGATAVGRSRPGRWHLARRARRRPRSVPDGPRRGRLVLVVAGLALCCTVLGGVIGGYIALHSTSPVTSPDYSLGTVPPGLTNRPASSIPGIAARVMPSVVMIKVNGNVGTGSGFIIKGSYIVTDNHVVTLDGEVSHPSLQVYFSNGKSAPGEIVGRDPYSDIAVIKAEGVSRLPTLSLGNSTGVDVGDPVIAVGSPLGLADTVTSGIVSAVDRPVQPGAADGAAPQVYFDAIQTDAPINPGNSGGPLVNARGQVIGVNAAIDTLGDNPLTGSEGGSIGLGFAIPINQARRVAVELIRTGHATHAVIGAELDPGWGGSGAEIAPATPGRTPAITPGGPAARAGLLPGDVIVKFGRQPVNDADTLLDAIRSMPPGAKASVTFVRAGQTRTVSLRLGSATS
jgi:S1-C subfamily serine protease